jgi:hypothetical protein
MSFLGAIRRKLSVTSSAVTSRMIIDYMRAYGQADAGFFHRLAVPRSHAGLGRGLIDWADRQTEAGGRPFLCLDAMTLNRWLRDCYEAMGFAEVGQIEGPGGTSSQRRPWPLAGHSLPTPRPPLPPVVHRPGHHHGMTRSLGQRLAQRDTFSS